MKELPGWRAMSRPEVRPEACSRHVKEMCEYFGGGITIVESEYFLHYLCSLLKKFCGW